MLIYLGIQTVVVLIGDPEQNAFPGYYSCIVQDPDRDIIVIDPAAPDYSTLKAALCKNEPDGYDVQITEVNPQSTEGTSGPSGTGGFVAFVEVYNFGAPADIRACLGDSGESGTNGCASAAQEVTVGTGEYLVASVGGGITSGDQSQNIGGSNDASSVWFDIFTFFFFVFANLRMMSIIYIHYNIE